jgi:hypothetical protein
MISHFSFQLINRIQSIELTPKGSLISLVEDIQVYPLIHSPSLLLNKSEVLL